MNIEFLGGTGTVTGSKYLVTAGNRQVLVDCGLFQGYKNLRERNWAPLPLDPASLDAVMLTHAHLDHSGYLPLLIKHGFSGPVFATPATIDLAAILLPDSGHIQEEDAEYANKKKFSKHEPALPLYTEADALAALDSFRPLDFDTRHRIDQNLSFRFLPDGHILGASMVQIESGETTLTFSGDLGRPDDPVMIPPRTGLSTDYLVCESTYGDRIHEHEDAASRLETIINSTAERKGVVLIPSFAVGRAQAVLYAIYTLMEAGRIPSMPVYLNSPMAVKTTDLYLKYPQDHRLTVGQLRELERDVRLVRSVEESKELNHLEGPGVIVSASGMLTGGRVLHHLRFIAPDERNTLVFVGYQAAGTRGRRILNGEDKVKIHGEWVPVRCNVEHIGGLSAHADANEIMQWLGTFERPPKRTFITHGEPDAAEALRVRIRSELGWEVGVPLLGEQDELTDSPDS
ncbi:MAG: MBL fold metallo-hydrolase [Gammaproteobacteria bacterium]|nr:MBL fold metallo-hydrolase [Gammaproteobacteria bacterium]